MPKKRYNAEEIGLPASTGPGSGLVYAALSRLGFLDQIEG